VHYVTCKEVQQTHFPTSLEGQSSMRCYHGMLLLKFSLRPAGLKKNVTTLSKNRDLDMLNVDGRTSRITSISVSKAKGIASALWFRVTRPFFPRCSCSWRVSGLNDKNAAKTGIYSVNDVMYHESHITSNHHTLSVLFHSNS
jgi:hypothetical protein